MPRLPQVSGRQLARLLERLGYRLVRQRGSHARYARTIDGGQHAVTVPLHDTIAKGTLNDILGRVSLHTGLSKDELIQRLT